VVSNFNDGDLSTLVDAEVQGCDVVFDRVYVSSAGATAGGLDVRSPDEVEAEVGWQVIIYFVLRYEFDGSFVTSPETLVVVNGLPAAYVVENDRWELAVSSNVTGHIDYRIDVFRDAYGLTVIVQSDKIPKVYWVPIEIIDPDIIPIIAAVGVVSATTVFFVRRTRRRVATLEEALTPEELLTLRDAKMPQDMRAQTIANLEWLKELPREIPNMPPDVLTLVWEELVKAQSMYERAFELDPPVGEAGEQLRKLLLERIESTIHLIDGEINSRA
jgi:hypothetical protein